MRSLIVGLSIVALVTLMAGVNILASAIPEWAGYLIVLAILAGLTYDFAKWVRNASR